MTGRREHFNPYDMRGEDWREVAIFLANAVRLLAPRESAEFLHLKEGMRAEWESADRFKHPWDLGGVVSPDNPDDDARMRHLLPEPIYRAFCAAYDPLDGDPADLLDD